MLQRPLGRASSLLPPPAPPSHSAIVASHGKLDTFKYGNTLNINTSMVGGNLQTRSPSHEEVEPNGISAAESHNPQTCDDLSLNREKSRKDGQQGNKLRNLSSQSLLVII